MRSATLPGGSRERNPQSVSRRALKFNFEVSRTAAGIEQTDSRFQVTKRVEAAGQDVAVWLTVEGAKEPGELSPGSDVTYVIRYANLGNQPAHRAIVKLSMWSGLAIVRAEWKPSSTSQSPKFGGGIAQWDLGDLDVGQSGSIRSVVHVASVDDDGALVNASIAADGIDIDSSNNTASIARAMRGR